MADERNDPPAPTVKEDPAFASLEQRIAAARTVEDVRQTQEHAPYADGRGGAFQIASTLVGYPVGGIVIGFVLDKIFGTLPWITIGLMFLAFIGACLQVMRSNSTRAK
ncbi:MAG: AtpZ/AtpI family protein [Croceibacterium sp.]